MCFSPDIKDSKTISSKVGPPLHGARVGPLPLSTRNIEEYLFEIEIDFEGEKNFGAGCILLLVTRTGWARQETQGRTARVSQDCGLNSPRNFAPRFGPVF